MRAFRKITFLPSLALMLVLGLFQACQSIVDFDADTEVQMAVSCYISPETEEISLNIFRLQLVGQAIPDDFSGVVVNDAEVSIINETQDRAIVLNYVAATGKYMRAVLDSFLRAGDEYQLEISHPSLPAVRATTRIPSKPPSLTGQVFSRFDQGRLLYFLQSSWLDEDIDTSYYRLLGRVKRIAFPDDPYFFFGWEGDESDPDYLEDTNEIPTLINGPLGNLQALASELSGFPSDRIAGDSVEVSFFKVSKSYFRFQQDLRQAANSDPLLAEPYVLFSNVEGGYGVFAAYTRQKYFWVIE